LQFPEATQDILLLILSGLVLALILISAILAIRLRSLSQRYQTLMEGATSENLERALADYARDARQALERIEQMTMDLKSLQHQVRFCIQHSGLVRFNAFRDTGGQLSFALALADASGNGVVLCSLYARDRSHIYAKPLVRWESPVSLSAEEQEAIRLARSEAEPLEPRN